jgi:DNA-binding NarL/FixJ family response regulator
VREKPGLRVAVVDDHPVTRLGLKTVLDAEEDMRVMGQASGGDEARGVVAEANPELVVLGPSLAGKPEGVEVCRRIKAMAGAPYVLVYAARDSAEEMLSYLLVKADSYLHDGGNVEALLDAVRRTAAGEKVREPRERAGELPSVVGITPEDVVSLTPRQLEVLALKLRRYSNTEIARALRISPNTVKHHVTGIYKKLGKGRGEVLRP